ncbi:MAG: sensor histidine kinase [Mycobacteriales bacterium]
MTRRILASFLAVLLGLLALVVVPLGASLSSQERRDFRHSTDSSARALAAIAEERLGDRAAGRGAGALRLPVEGGDGVLLLDPQGRQLATEGRPVGGTVVEQVRLGRRPGLADAAVSAAIVGEAGRLDGTIILVRDTEPLDHRIHELWLGLAAAAAVALAVGALVAGGLARWIGRPLHDLRAVAVRMGEGDVTARTGERLGPKEVRAVATAFDEMADRIGSLLDSQRVMTADVSHQLRTPLAALRLRLELLAEDAPDELRVELLGALREIARLSRLADGLLAVARAEEVTASPEPIDVAAIAGERVDLWHPVAQERGVALSSEISAGSAWATPGHLEQVFDNLVANALDALDPGHRVRVSVQPENGEVLLRVADDGPGMSEQRRETAFVRFVSDRSGPTKTGLGLAIVGRLVAADHGTTSLEQTPGGGLTAVVRLPVADNSRATPAGVAG